MGTNTISAGQRSRARRVVARSFRVARVTTVGLLAVLILNGAAAKPKVKSSKPWFDGRNLVSFPLADDVTLPGDAAALAKSIVKGWKRTALNLPKGGDLIAVTGTYPTLDAMRVNLSNAEVDSKRKAAKVSDRAKALRTLGVADLRLTATPIKLGPASTASFGIAATDAKFAVKRDADGKPLMTMTDARDARLEFAMAKADVERLLLHAARENAAKLGFNVTAVTLALSTVSDREAIGELDVRTKFAFIGANLHFTGRIKIADDMTARVSDLTCEGDDVLGPIVVGFLRPGLAKVNNQSKPIVGFASKKMRLRDVRLRADDEIRVAATFGR